MLGRKAALLFLVFTMLAVLPGVVGGGDPKRQGASDFRSNGDLIDGWYWLRDELFQQYAEWIFTGIPTGTEQLTVELSALAVDSTSDAPVDAARFRLVYGCPGAGGATGLYEFQVVTLAPESSATVPGGVIYKGEITLSCSAFPSLSPFVFRVERDAPGDNDVAFNAGSLAVLAPEAITAEPQLETVGADGFAATGDLIGGAVWCRKAGQFLEWRWAPREAAGNLLSAAVNLSLLVTTSSGGASGLSAVADVTVLDPDGAVAEVGTVHLVNTFRPLFTGDSGGVGWMTTGAYKLKDPGLVERGFTLRVALSGSIPPEAPAETASLGRQIGGEQSSATLAYVMDPVPVSEVGTAIPATIYDILSDPQSFDGKRVSVEARFYGRSEGLSPCLPQTPSDWLIGAQQFYMYVTNGTGSTLPPWEMLAFERPILVTGTVQAALQSGSFVCPYLKVEAVEMRDE